MLQAASPFLFGLLLDRVGIEAAGLSAGLCLAAFGSLFLLRPRRTTADIDMVALDHRSHGGPRIEQMHASKSSSLNGLVK
jgi:hypothetical protein